MKVFGPGDQPFLTEDSVLAFAMYMAFAKFCDDDQPCVNYYTTDMLRKMGYRGMLPAEAALQATEEGRKGVVTYVMKPIEPRLLQAFEDQKRTIENSEGLACDVIKNLMTDWHVGAREYDETIVRIICTVIYMRAEFLKMWQKLEPLIKIDSDGKAHRQDLPDGSYVITHEGFKFIGAKASQKTKEHLGLC